MSDLKLVLVTGATGYIGGHLIPCLLDEGYQVRAFVRNPHKLENYNWRKRIQIAVGDVFLSETLESAMADVLEESLFKYVVDVWYPLNIDTIYGGYLSNYSYDWQYDTEDETKFIVQQTRHVWATSFLYEFYPDRKEFLEYANHGFEFLKDHMWTNL